MNTTAAVLAGYFSGHEATIYFSIASGTRYTSKNLTQTSARNYYASGFSSCDQLDLVTGWVFSFFFLQTFSNWRETREKLYSTFCSNGVFRAGIYALLCILLCALFLLPGQTFNCFRDWKTVDQQILSYLETSIGGFEVYKNGKYSIGWRKLSPLQGGAKTNSKEGNEEPPDPHVNPIEPFRNIWALLIVELWGTKKRGSGARVGNYKKNALRKQVNLVE